MDENSKSTNPLDAVHGTREALVTFGHTQRAIRGGSRPAQDRIILACKVSSAPRLLIRRAPLELARRCDYPLHLGLTEASMGSKGIVASTAAMAVLLQQGIGDTIRVSSRRSGTAIPRAEVVVAQEILQNTGPAVVFPAGSARARDAGAPRASSSRMSLTRSRLTCVCRCRLGASDVPGGRELTVAAHGLRSERTGRIQDGQRRTACRGPGRCPSPPSMSTARKP